MKYNKKGVSLIVLVITIVVIIILAGVVVMTLTNNNPIENASKAKFLNNVRSYETELQLYQQNGYADNIGQYNPSTLEADATAVTYNGQTIDNKTIYDILPSLNKDEEYKDKFIILDGELVYTGIENREISWLGNINVKTSTAEPITNISDADINILQKEVKYKVTFTSNYPLSKMNLDNNIKIVDENNVEVPDQPTITIGQLSGSDSDKVRNVEITIDSSTLGDSKYKLIIKAGAVKNSNDIFNTQDIISNSSFSVDNIAPINPDMSVESTIWTNVSVIVTITYTEDSAIKEFSTDGTTWQTYTSPIEVTENNITVYSRATDTSGNQSGQSTLTVANIDKIAPTVEFGTNGSSDIKEATTTVTLSDLGGSNINPDSLQYVWDIQDASEPTSGWNTFTNGQTLTKNSETGTYYLWIKGSDNAGNAVVAKSNAFGLDNTAPINPSMIASPTVWTNSNVTVTITYPSDAVVKEYSTNGTTWSTYTTPVIVGTNNTTVYAKATDAAGNQSGQSTLTVANIDKVVPVVTAGNGGTTTSSVTVIATASDAGGSGLNISSYQYSKDNGVTWTSTTSATSYTFSTLATGTYQCKVKVTDNAGNATTSNAVSIVTTAVGTISMVANPTVWTNSNVTVTCNYPSEIVTKQYSLDGSNWNTYSSALTITTNGTVYARGYDAGNNQTMQATITITNIDKTAPIVTVGNGGATTSSVTVIATTSDAGGSGLNTSSYQYSKDNGVTWTSATSATSYTFSALTTGTYQCKAKVTDNAGNATTSNMVSIATTAVGTISMVANPTTWTNGNVTVTCNYPSEIVAKQYSLDGTNWNTYSSAVIMTANGTVYARGYDAGNNQTAQATIAVTNIDKTPPVVNFTGEITVNINTVVDSTFLKNNTTITDNVSSISEITINNIVVKNSVDAVVSNTLSGYDVFTVTYSVVDKAGNSTNVVRSIVTKPTSSLTLTNLMPDSSFETGSEYWYNTAVSRVTERAYNGSYSLRTYSNSAQCWPRYDYNSYNFLGKAVYTRVYVYRTLDTIYPGITLIFGATADQWPLNDDQYANYYDPVPLNQWTGLSILASNAKYPYLKIMLPQVNQNAVGYAWHDGLMIIDLNTTFGSNIPSKKWMDKMVPYFSGTTTLSW